MATNKPKTPENAAKPRGKAAASGGGRGLGLFATGSLFAIGAAVLAAGAGIYAAFARAGRDEEGHTAPDLAIDKPHPGPTDRAPDAFRPDPTAPVPASEREALRPATGPAPSLVADRGTMNAQIGAGN